MTAEEDIFSISSAEKEESKHKSSSSCIRTRHIVLLLCVMSNAISYTMRTNLNMTIVTMVRESENQTNSDTCLVNNDDNSSSLLVSTLKTNFEPKSTRNQEDLFDWSESLQGTIIGAFYYGYIITMAFGGQLAEYFGTKKLIIISIMASSACTLLIPICAFTHPYLLIAVRVVTGMVLALITPAMYTILPHWVPKSEMGMAFGLMHSSGNLGAVLTMPICAFLSEYGFAGGWPSVFYVFGITALLFLLPWVYFVYNSPETHPRISEAEQKYIAQNISISSAKSRSKHKAFVPWRSILTSSKVWALTVTRFCGTWGNLFLMSKLPAYLKSVLHMPIAYNSYVNASIYISLGSSILLWGYVSDYVGRKQWIHKTTSRKLFQSIGLFGGAFFMGIVPLMGCNVMVIIVLLNLSMITIGLTTGGENLAVVDIAPDYAGSIYAFTNSISSLPGFLAPQFVGILLDNSNDNQMHQWNIMFWSASSIYVLGALVFIFGTNSEPEKWGLRIEDLNSIETASPTAECKTNAVKTIIK